MLMHLLFAMKSYDSYPWSFVLYMPFLMSVIVCVCFNMHLSLAFFDRFMLVYRHVENVLVE